MFPKYITQYYVQTSSTFMKSPSTLVNQLCETNNLIDVLLDDLQNYLNGQAIDEGYPHSKNVAYRLKAIKFILETAEDKKVLTADHVERTWKILYL